MSHPISLSVSDMSCEGCVDSVTKIVHTVDPAAEIQVDLATGLVTGSAQKDANTLVAALTKGGYPATILHPNQP